MNIETANKLQKIRKEKGYTQESLADALGISRQAVSKWERAEASPDTDNLILLAKLYGVSLDELLNGVDEETTEDIKFANEDKKEEEKKLGNDEVHIGKDGIHVKSEDGDEVVIDNDGIHINGESIQDKRKKETNPARRKRYHVAQSIVSSVTSLLVVIGYILLGSLYNLWHPGWIIFFLIPIVTTIVEAIYQRRFRVFAFPVLVTAVYLFIGCAYPQEWHPWWVIFLLIPIYYSIFTPIDHLIEDKHKDEVLLDLDYDEKHPKKHDVIENDD